MTAPLHRWVPLVVALTILATSPLDAGAATDPFLAQQWALHTVGAPSAWGTGRGAGVRIAVVDTGIDLGHEDLGAHVVAHVDCLGADDDPGACHGSGQDDHGHGTHVAGIAAALSGNGTGVASVAPDARLMAVKVLAPDGTGSASGSVADIRAGIRWAVGHGAGVVNLSLGPDINLLGLLGTGLEDAIDDAWDAGVITVVAAGNDALFPTGYDDVAALVVTATDRDDRRASYASNVAGAEWGMAAPGGDGFAESGLILSTWWDAAGKEPYAYLSGTSMAAPHVAGAAAVLLSLGLTPEEVVNRLLSTAADLGAPGTDSTYGAGRLDVAAAVAGLGGTGAGGGTGGGAPGSSPGPPATAAPGSPSNIGEATAGGAAAPSPLVPRPPERPAPSPRDATPAGETPVSPSSAPLLSGPAPTERGDGPGGPGWPALLVAGALLAALVALGRLATARRTARGRPVR